MHTRKMFIYTFLSQKRPLREKENTAKNVLQWSLATAQWSLAAAQWSLAAAQWLSLIHI